MRPIYLARMDKTRPVLIMSRGGQTIGRARDLVVAGITTTTKGTITEVPVGTANGLDRDCVVNTEDIQTIRQTQLGQHVGYLFPDQEPALTAAVMIAFDLDLID